MKHTTIILGALALAAASCSKSAQPHAPATSLAPCGNYLTRTYAGLDTATLWYYNDAGVRTGDYARFNSSGYIAVTNVSGTAPTGYISGSYYPCVHDSTGYTPITFGFYRSGVDTLISNDNLLFVYPAGTRHGYSLELGQSPYEGRFIDTI